MTKKIDNVVAEAAAKAEKQVHTELGFFQAVSLGIKAPIKIAAITGIAAGTAADSLFEDAPYIREGVGELVDLFAITLAASARKAKRECLGSIKDKKNIKQTLDDVEAYWETK